MAFPSASLIHAPTTLIAETHHALASDAIGYAFIPANRLFLTSPESLPSLLASWSRLPIDAPGQRSDRERRLSKLQFFPELMDFELLPDTSLLQSNRYNAVMGDVLRHYEPIEQFVLESSIFRSLIQLQFQLLPLQPEAKQVPWLIEVHQIRIVTTPKQSGQPTPYGRHREGWEFAFHTLFNRSGVSGAESIVFDLEASSDFRAVGIRPDGTPLYDYERVRVQLEHPLDMLALWDEVVKHGTTPAIATPGSTQGTRDMLLTFFARQT